MKTLKRILALALVAAMLVSSCVFVNAASASVSMSGAWSYDVVSGVSYTTYSVYGSSSGHTETVHTLTFNPDDGYIAIPYTQYAGNTATIQSQFNAAKAAGYEVVGAINGAFFDMTSGTPYGAIASNGVLQYSALWTGCNPAKPGAAGGDAGDKDELVTFGYDGSIELVYSYHDWTIDLNGNVISGGNVNINRHHDQEAASADVWLANQVYYYDRSCGSYTDSSAYHPGVEVVCEKLDNTEMGFGAPLKGKVVSVKTNTYGSAIGENQFVLFAITSSTSNAYKYLSALKAGDPVTVNTVNYVNGANDILNSKAGAMYHCGSLMKDGSDLCASYSEIGDGHYVNSTYAQWTVFGTKPDGTVVFMTTEGGDTGNSSRSLHLADVSAAMKALGCTNVYRCDGGGSTGMYVSNTGSGSAGYKHSASRAVTDVILIVKKTGLATTAMRTELQNQINTAKTLVSEVPSIQTLIDEGEALLARNAANGEMRPTLVELTEAVKNNTSLTGLIDRVESLDVTKYSEEVLSEVRSLYVTAKSLVEKGDTTSATATATYNALKAALKREGEGTLNEIALVTNKFNTSIDTNDCTIFTPAFGTITEGNANHKWTVNILLEWNASKNCYIVKSAKTNEAWGENGAQTAPSYTLTSNQVLVAVHGENTLVNRQMAAKVKEGDQARLCGIDVTNRTFTAPAYIVFGEIAHECEFTNYVSNNDATCTKDGTKTATCSCGEKNTVTDTGSKLDHKYTNYKSNGDATCNANGTKTASCDYGCGTKNTVTETGSKLTHSYTNYVSNNDATCTKDGTKTAKCDHGCGTKNTVTDTGSKLDHSFTNYKSNDDATCLKDGTKTAACDNGCGSKKTVTDEGTKLKHSFTNYVPNGDKTCTEDGTKTASCDNGCGATATLKDPANGHSFTNYVSNNDATCTEDGTKTATCDNGCGEKDTVTETGTKGHLAGEWEVVKEAQIGEPGLMEKHCTKCGELIDTREIPALDAEYSLGDIDEDGAITSADYVFVKRAVMGTYTLTERALKAADIDMDGVITSADYVFVKRAVMGTYAINK